MSSEERLRVAADEIDAHCDGAIDQPWSATCREAADELRELRRLLERAKYDWSLTMQREVDEFLARTSRIEKSQAETSEG